MSWVAVAVGFEVANIVYGIVSNEDAKRQAEHARDTQQSMVDAEVAERNRLALERAQAVMTEAQRERALAISNQEAQNIRVNATC